MQGQSTKKEGRAQALSPLLAKLSRRQLENQGEACPMVRCYRSYRKSLAVSLVYSYRNCFVRVCIGLVAPQTPGTLRKSVPRLAPAGAASPRRQCKPRRPQPVCFRAEKNLRPPVWYGENPPGSSSNWWCLKGNQDATGW